MLIEEFSMPGTEQGSGDLRHLKSNPCLQKETYLESVSVTGGVVSWHYNEEPHALRGSN